MRPFANKEGEKNPEQRVKILKKRFKEDMDALEKKSKAFSCLVYPHPIQGRETPIILLFPENGQKKYGNDTLRHQSILREWRIRRGNELAFIPNPEEFSKGIINIRLAYGKGGINKSLDFSYKKAQKEGNPVKLAERLIAEYGLDQAGDIDGESIIYKKIEATIAGVQMKGIFQEYFKIVRKQYGQAVAKEYKRIYEKRKNGRLLETNEERQINKWERYASSQREKS